MKTTLMLAAAALATGGLQAQETTLRVVSAFSENTQYVKNLEGFIGKVNNAGKGVVHLNFIGGPKEAPPLRGGNRGRTGVGGLPPTTRAFYNNILPGGDALEPTHRSGIELREDRGHEP